MTPIINRFLGEIGTSVRQWFTAGLLTGTLFQDAAGQSLPPLIQVGPITERSSVSFASVAAVRELPHRKLLVNDIVSRRVFIVDSALNRMTLVLDSTTGSQNSYGDSPGGIIPYRGDSTLFVDPSSVSMLVIDPQASIARVMAGPRLSDVPYLVGGPFGTPGFDAVGRLIHRGSARNRAIPRLTGNRDPQPESDSAPILRLDLHSRKIDTAALFKFAKTVVMHTQTSDGRIKTRIKRQPLPEVDDWAVLPDGSIAIVRGRNFHVDWINADGTRTSSEKIPFVWRKLDEDQKIAFMDSVREETDSMIARQKVSLAERFKSRGTEPPEIAEPAYPSPTELPDYFPPFGPNAAHADRSGVIWVLTSEIVDGRPVYYLLNRLGKLTARVQLPPGRVIAGFGANRVVYLAFIDASRNVHIERAMSL